MWYIIIGVGKVLIGLVGINEDRRKQKMVCEYESLLTKLPKGSVTCRKNGYYYLRYRENGKIYDKYIGKDTGEVNKIREKLILRKHYTEMLLALQKEQKAIHKILEGLK